MLLFILCGDHEWLATKHAILCFKIYLFGLSLSNSDVLKFLFLFLFSSSLVSCLFVNYYEIA